MPLAKARHIKLIGIFLAAVFLITAFYSPSPVEAATGTVTGSVVNIRLGPGTTYEIAGSIYKDAEVEVLQTSGEWHQIKYNGSRTGWVHSSLLSVKTPILLQVTGETVNLRSGPDTCNSKVGQVSKGDILELVDVYDDWYKVKTADGTVAYVAAFLVSKAGNGNTSSPPTPAPTPTPAPAPKPQPQTPSNDSSAPAVYIDSKLVSFDVPPIIQNGRTLVPLRAIFEAMGASVSWDGTNQTVTAKRGDTTIILKVGSTQPTVNGQVWPLDVPAKIVSDRTLAPLRFVGEAYGGTVAWNEASRTINISSPSASTNKKPVSVAVNDTVNLRTGPSTSYETVDQAQPGEKLPVIAEQNGWYQVSRGGRTSWVAGWVVNPSWEATEPVVPTPEPEPVPPVKPTPEPEKPKTDEIRLSSGKDATGIAIKITSGRKLDVEPEKTNVGLTYEFKDMTLEGLNFIKQEIGSKTVKVKGVNRGDDAVVYAEIPSGINYLTTSENSGKTIVIKIPNCVIGMNDKLFGSSGEQLIITTLTPVEYEKKQDGDRITITLKNVMKGNIGDEYNYNNEIIKNVLVEQNKNNLVLTIDVKDLGKYTVGKGSDGTSLHIMMRSKSQIKPRNENLIVIDPGHGGKDSGAIGRGDHLMEKTVTLDISLKLGNLLKQKGYDVEYTRTDDTYVGLEERAQFANQRNAAIFVSIHNNSCTSTEPMGTETYYYAPESNPDLFIQKDEREALARSVHTQLIQKLRRMDRGVKTNNYSVLRNTQMPSILCEIAFLSNATEEKLLQNEDFKALAAEAIAEGIDNYMKNR